MAKQTKKDASGAEASFDERLAELETIVGELEDGGLELDPAIGRYQRGIELLRTCRATLEGYRKQVQELTRDAEGALRPFDADPDVEGSDDRRG